MTNLLGLHEELDDQIETMIESVTMVLNKSAFIGDRMITFDKTTAFLKDAKFAAALEKCALAADDRGRSWRVNTLAWAAKKALTLEGDFVECGVFEGFMSNMLVEYLDFAGTDRTFYLYDTFDGFPSAYSSPEDFPGSEGFWHFANEVYGKAGLYELVLARFEPYNNVKVIRGIVPDILHDVSPAKISYLHMDLNSPRAETAGLEILFDRVVSGGVIIFDDYGWDTYRSQMDAADKFMGERGQFVLELPTGQGLVVKN